MKILFIGGTKFVGRQIAEDALAQGHEVIILQRGKTNADLFPQTKKYYADRKDIASVIPASEYFDMVVDSCGYHPDVVLTSCNYLKDKTKQYVFISTCSVYSDFSIEGLNEQSVVSVVNPVPPVSDAITNENYGPLKALCEKVVIETIGAAHSLILRPCIIVGPYDETKRFDYWIGSILKSSELIVPDDPQASYQFVDVRALSHFVLSSADNKRTGIFNTIGPKEKIKFLDFIQLAKTLLNPQLKIIKSSDLTQNYPMYVNDKNWKGFFEFDGSKAYNNGMVQISVEDTILTTAEYIKSKQI